MYVPIVCFSCGAPIGDLEDIYRAIHAKKVKAKLAELMGNNELMDNNKTPSNIAINSSLQISCEEELTKMGITAYCCRTHLVTSMRFSDKY